MQRHLELCLHLHPLLGPLRRNTSGRPASPVSHKGNPLCGASRERCKAHLGHYTHALMSLVAGTCCCWPTEVTCEPSTTKALQAVWNFPPGAVITAAGMVHPATLEATRSPGFLPRINPLVAGSCCRSQTTHSKPQRNLHGSFLDIFMDPGVSIPKKQLLLMAGSAIPGRMLS